MNTIPIMRGKQCKLYKVNGDIEDILPESKTKGFTLEEVYKILDISMVQAVPLVASDGSEYTLLCDEEGKLVNNWADKINIEATKVWNQFYGDTDIIVGDVIICSTEYFK